jgi:hypothetical protein
MTARPYLFGIDGRDVFYLRTALLELAEMYEDTDYEADDERAEHIRYLMGRLDRAVSTQMQVIETHDYALGGDSDASGD